MVKTRKGNNAAEAKSYGYKYSWIAQFPPSLLYALSCSSAHVQYFSLRGPLWEEINQFPQKQNVGTLKHPQHIYATAQSMQRLLSISCHGNAILWAATQSSHF